MWSLLGKGDIVFLFFGFCVLFHWNRELMSKVFFLARLLISGPLARTVGFSWSFLSVSIGISGLLVSLAPSPHSRTYEKKDTQELTTMLLFKDPISLLSLHLQKLLFVLHIISRGFSYTYKRNMERCIYCLRTISQPLF